MGTADISQLIKKNLTDIKQQEILAEKASLENEKQLRLLQQAEAKAEYMQQLKKLKYLTQQLAADPDHANLTELYKALEELKSSRLRETGYALLALFAHQRNNSTLFTNSITQGGKNVERYISSIHQKCRYCKGGMKKCLSCQTTGICGRCNGEGQYESTVVEDMHFVTKTFSCIKICYYCTACKSCGGTGSITLQSRSSGLKGPEPEPPGFGSNRADACQSCNGTGQIPIQARKCTYCNGTGKNRLTSQQIKYYIKNKLAEFSNILHQATMTI